MAIAGFGSVDCDLEADEIKVARSVDLKGSVNAVKLSSECSCRIKGKVGPGHLKSSVSFDAAANVVAHSVETTRACIVRGSLRAPDSLDFPNLK